MTKRSVLRTHAICDLALVVGGGRNPGVLLPCGVRVRCLDFPVRCNSPAIPAMPPITRTSKTVSDMGPSFANMALYKTCVICLRQSPDVQLDGCGYCCQLAGFSTEFAGLSKDSDELISSEHIEWADVIAVMEQRQKSRLNAMFGCYLSTKRVVVLHIPDRFDYMEPALVERLLPVLTRVFQA